MIKNDIMKFLSFICNEILQIQLLVAKILLPMRRWGMGRSKGLCRCIYASIVCLLAVRSPERIVPFIHKPVKRSIEMGSYGGIPSSWSIYINFR